MERYRDKVISKGDDQYAQTPSYLLKYLTTLFQIKFDACPSNPTYDGLLVPWNNTTYCNPPYKSIGPWLIKAIQEWRRANIVSIFLIPVRLYAKYTKFALDSLSVIYFATHIVKFNNYKAPLSIGLCVWVQGNMTTLPLPAPYNIFVCSVEKPYTYEKATQLFCDCGIAEYIIVDGSTTDTVKKVYKEWQQHTHQTIGLLMPIQTKSRVFKDIILPYASYLGFCDHLLKAVPGSHEFWMGSALVVFGPRGKQCREHKSNTHTIRAGFINTSAVERNE